MEFKCAIVSHLAMPVYGVCVSVCVPVPTEARRRRWVTVCEQVTVGAGI